MFQTLIQTPESSIPVVTNGCAKKMASTPEQVVCTPTFVTFPTPFSVGGLQFWKEEQKEVLTICNSPTPWPDYRGFDPRSHIANFHVAAAAPQPQTLQPAEDSKTKAGNRSGVKNHIATQNDFTSARNLIVATASAPPAFPGIEAGIRISNPNLDKQSQAQSETQQQQTLQQQTQQQQTSNQPQSQQNQSHQHSPEDNLLVETKEREWPCPSCKVPFKQASELQAHLSAHTKTEKSVPCDICGKYFASGDRVRIHVKAAHGEKSCSCEVCGSGFSYRCKLLDHMRTHTGDKPFHCEVCGKSFSQKNHLTRHNMIHTGERPYPCDFCGRGFYRKDKLTRHRRIHTGERVTGSQPRKRASAPFGTKMSAAARRSLEQHQASTSGQAQAVPTNSIKMEGTLTDANNPSTSSSTSLSFAPATLTPSISPSHYRASPYKPNEWQGPPSGVH